MPDARRSPSEPERFPVPESLAGERLDRAVALLTGWSRADAQALVSAGDVRVDGRRAEKAHRLRDGETIEIWGQPTPPGPPEPEPLSLDVRYEDRWLAVVAKPAGLVVHPGGGNERGTLVNGLLARWPHAAGVGDPMRPGIVHRLDRYTSGLLVVALTPEAYEALVAMVAERRVVRRYLALVWGVPDVPRGRIDAPVGRSLRRRTEMAVTPRGREARTEYRVLEAFAEAGVALLDVELQTGRTHQIRVHLSAIGHPVVGDPVYGRHRRGLLEGRPFLHAHLLAFDHPVTGEHLEVEEPLPPDLQAVVDGLRAARA